MTRRKIRLAFPASGVPEITRYWLATRSWPSRGRPYFSGCGVSPATKPLALLAGRVTPGHIDELSADVCRILVGPQPLVRRVTNVAVVGPLHEGHLADHPLFQPDRVSHPEAGRQTDVEWSERPFDLLEGRQE